MLKSIFNVLVLLSFYLWSNPSAHACASCSFNDDTNNYFLVLIIFMTTLPVVFVGSIIYYLKKQREKNENQS